MQFYSLLYLFAWFNLVTDTVGNYHGGSVIGKRGSDKTTTLRAITSRSPFSKREERLLPKHSHEHYYADHASISSGETSRFAKTTTTYKIPALSLEDFEFDVDSIRCDRSIVSLSFLSKQTLQDSRANWDNLKEFLIVTSHPGCNEDGERLPYLVSDATYSTDLRTVNLSVKPINWNDAYHSMDVAFGMGQYGTAAIRSHESLGRRQDTAVSFSNATLTSSQVTVSATSSFPMPSTGTPSANSTTYKLNYSTPANDQIVDISLPDDDGEGSVSANLTISCKECSISGTVELTEGAFTISSSTDFIIEAKNFIDNGYFMAKFNDIQAHVELDTSLALSATQSFDEILATLGLPGFQIPGVAVIGPFFRPHIKGSLDIDAELDFTYGFEFSMPNEADITITIGNLTNSSTNGFDQSTITALPFTASSSMALNLGIGLYAELLIGVSIENNDGDLDAGAFIDLPYLNISVTQVSEVTKNCEPINSTTSSSNTYSNLTHMTFDVLLDAGVESNLDIDIDIDVATLVYSKGAEATMMQTTMELPTACLSWDGSKAAFQTLAGVGANQDSKQASGGGKVVGRLGWVWGAVGVFSLLAL